jgi:hypothetical protein
MEFNTGVQNPHYLYLLEDRNFVQELFHPAREQAFLNVLFSLFQYKKDTFYKLVALCKTISVFPIVLTKRIQQHQQGTRCEMYRFFLKEGTSYTSCQLCWNCWSCIAWALKQNNPRFLDMYNSFGMYVSRINQNIFHQTGYRVFLDICVSQYLLGKDHHLRILLQHFLRILPLEEYKSFLLGLLSQPVFLFVLFEKKEKDYLPLAFQEEPILQEIKRAVKQSIKRITDTFKEELMQRTWHPRRLFPWCLDIEEWKEFGVSSRDCTEVYTGE